MGAARSSSPGALRRPVGRREALRIGGVSISLAAIAAACGEDRGGDTAPGRVGNATAPTDPPSLPVDDAVLLRTTSSLEHTTVNAYRQMLALGGLDDVVESLLEEYIDNHLTVAGELEQLTADIGGEPWSCVNPWYMQRTVSPLMAAVVASDAPATDMFNIAVTMENLNASTNQAFAVRLGEPETRVSTLSAAKLESRQSALLVVSVRGAEGYVSPALSGDGEATDETGRPIQFAITSRFGSIGQQDLVAGPPDENGVRETFSVQIPAENSYIYNELEPIC